MLGVDGEPGGGGAADAVLGDVDLEDVRCSRAIARPKFSSPVIPVEFGSMIEALHRATDHWPRDADAGLAFLELRKELASGPAPTPEGQVRRHDVSDAQRLKARELQEHETEDVVHQFDARNDAIREVLNGK
jgi:hypothetical protein